MSLINKVCGLCGSDDLVASGPLYWDLVSQTWVSNGDTYDDPYCNNCNSELKNRHVNERPLTKEELTKIQEDNVKKGPDIFIACHNDDPIQVFSNNPDSMGNVVFFEATDEEVPLIHDDLIFPKVKKISGNFESWLTKFEPLPKGSCSLKTFLEEFMIKNT